MYATAKPEKKKTVAALLIPIVFTAVVSGIKAVGSSVSSVFGAVGSFIGGLFGW